MKFKDWYGNKVFKESGYSRVRRILFGDVPNVKTIGIVTAHNPNGQQPVAGNDIESSRENSRLNSSLEEYLRTRNYGPIRVKGHFGIKEDSFLIPNIGKEELIKIGQWFEQMAVIWGEKEIDHNGNPYLRFEYIDVESQRTQSVRTVHLGGGDVQDRKDYYTMINGKKFIIPFFDDPLSKKIPSSKYGSTTDIPSSDDVDSFHLGLKKAESFEIPFFDCPTTEILFDDKVNEITYFSDRLPKNEEIKKIIEDIKNHSEKVLEKDRIDNYYWHHRGIVRECLWRLNKNYGR